MTPGTDARTALCFALPDRPSNSPMKLPSGLATPVRMWLWTSAENAARSYQCGDDGCDGVHFDHA